MPKLVRTINYYTCSFKCGTSAKPLYKMEDHEKNCFCNPENKSCRLCKHLNVDPLYIECDILKLYMNNRDKLTIFDSKTDLPIWTEEIKHTNPLSPFDDVPNPRPFPMKNCMHFELSKKRY